MRRFPSHGQKPAINVADDSMRGSASAMQKEEFEVDLNSPPLAMWQALDARPRPSFILRVPLRHEWPPEELPLVRGPLVVKNSARQPLGGVVLGPNDTPMMGVQVEIPTLNLSAQTDFRGRFRFAAIPPVRQVTLRAKGRRLQVPIDQAEKSDDLLLLRFPLMEG
jgi:hypothetical protein